MGYRSKVAIAIHKDVQGEFLTFLNTERLMADIFGDRSCFNLDKDFQDKEHWLFTADSIKWYNTWDEYKDIQMFEKFFTAMDEANGTIQKYRFIRIGEQNDDVEERGQWFDSDIHVKREIAIGW
jgi:hypothetical protein